MMIKDFVGAAERINDIITTADQSVIQTSESAKKIKEVVDSGTVEMKNMLDAMENIGQSSKGISEIIKIIDSIASQTNLLALNAAIELQEQEILEEGLQLLLMRYVIWLLEVQKRLKKLSLWSK